MSNPKSSCRLVHLKILDLKNLDESTASRKVIQRFSSGILEATYRVSSEHLSLRYHFDEYHGNLTIKFLKDGKELSYYQSSYDNHTSKSYRLYDIDNGRRLVDQYDLKSFGGSIDTLIDPFIENLKVIVDRRVEMEAATRIQKAFRGWSTRHKYRYDPHNGLGAFVARKMFETCERVQCL